MNTIRVEINDWLFNAGLVGLYRILKNADQEVIKKDNYIEFDSQALEGFENHYFNYFNSVYEKDSVWYKAVEFLKSKMPGLSDGNENEIEPSDIEDFVSEFEKLLNAASYSRAYEIITGDANFLKEKFKILKNKTINILEKRLKVKEIFDFMTDDFNKKIILAKFASYTIINNYWSDVSFLNKQKVKENMFDLYKKDFVDKTSRFLTLKSNTEKYYCRCMSCDSIVNKKSDGCEGLSWVKMDLDSKRKTSIYWNHQPNTIFCPICYLIYTCIPAGFITHKKKGLFINDNSNIERLIGINDIAMDSFGKVESFENMENITYMNIINMILNVREENLKREINNIQVVKSDNQKKSSKAGSQVYSFNILSKNVIEVIEKSKDQLNKLAKAKPVPIDKKNWINLYEEVIKSIYQNISLYPLIALLLHSSLKQKKQNFYTNIIFRINLNYIGGHMVEKKIFAMKNLGRELKKGYKEEENKINGIAYRLLNNLKTKNVNSFLDIVINSHMHISKEVPTLFVECINDVEQFQAYGYAFLLGLMGEDYQKTDKKVDN